MRQHLKRKVNMQFELRADFSWLNKVYKGKQGKSSEPIKIHYDSSESCHGVISASPWLKWEVMTQEYWFSTYLHFPKGRVPLYWLTLHLKDNVKRCKVVKHEPISQHKILTIKRQQWLTKQYSNQTSSAKTTVENCICKVLTGNVSNGMGILNEWVYMAFRGFGHWFLRVK